MRRLFPHIREEKTMRILESRAIRRISGPKKEEMTGEERKM
jgi:hypothetical protein